MEMTSPLLGFSDGRSLYSPYIPGRAGSLAQISGARQIEAQLSLPQFAFTSSRAAHYSSHESHLQGSGQYLALGAREGSGSLSLPIPRTPIA